MRYLLLAAHVTRLAVRQKHTLFRRNSTLHIMQYPLHQWMASPAAIRAATLLGSSRKDIIFNSSSFNTDATHSQEPHRRVSPLHHHTGAVHHHTGTVHHHTGAVHHHTGAHHSAQLSPLQFQVRSAEEQPPSSSLLGDIQLFFFGPSQPSQIDVR